MESLDDCYYFPVPSQCNSHAILEIPVRNGATKLIFSTVKREVYLFEFQDLSTALVPRVREIPFCGIPNGAEILSLCVFNKASNGNNFVMALTLCKNNAELKTLETYLNIYSNWEDSPEFNIDAVAQNCSTSELSYVPYYVYHTYFVSWTADGVGRKEHVLLISGDDNHIHVYREHNTERTYREHDAKELFPELGKTTSLVLKISVWYAKDLSFRIVGVCTEDSWVRVTKTDTKANKVMFSFCTKFDNVIPSISLFEQFEYPKNCSGRKRFSDFRKRVAKRKSKLDMVVVNSLLPSVLFRNILEYGLTNFSALPRSEEDVNIFTDVQCVDVDLDGTKEILIASCNKSLNMYKADRKKIWFLESLKMFPSPVLTHLYCDINGDGIKELVVVTLRGLIFLEHDHEYLNKILEARVQQLLLPNNQ